MASFFSNILGNEEFAKKAGKTVGDLVENSLNNVQGEGKEQAEGGTKDDNKEGFNAGDALVGGKNDDSKGGFNVEDVLSVVGGKNDDSKGGFNVEDVLSVVGGNKEGDEKGSDVSSAIKGFFN